MGKIKMLGDDLINKIAAGEVVERPASVVKELVENALDAGAGRIDIQIEQGGRSLIRIVDDGCGMTQEDALMALQRHATSKIRHEDDLFRIMTMGFRGEAIPSIASISRFAIETRAEGEEAGVRVFVEGGKPPEVTPIGRPVGTTIEVRDIFFNTPARRKFLKAESTEISHITDTVTRIALAHPEVRFSLMGNRRSILQMPATADLRERIGVVLGRQIADALYPFEMGEGWLKLRGFFSQPDVNYNASRGIYLFVNGRYFRHRSLIHACQEAYRGTMEKGRYPYVVAFLEIDPSEVDVNAHPQKIEVRFHREEDIYTRFYTTLRNRIATTPWIDRTRGRLAGGSEGGAKPALLSASGEAQGGGVTKEQGGAGADDSLLSDTPSPVQEGHPQENESSSTQEKKEAVTRGVGKTSQEKREGGALPSEVANPSGETTETTGKTDTAKKIDQAPRTFDEFRARFLKAAEAQKQSALEEQTEAPALAPLPSAQKNLPFLRGWDPAAGGSTNRHPSVAAGSSSSSGMGASASAAVSSSAAPFDSTFAGSREADASMASSLSRDGATKEGREETPSQLGFFSSLRYIGQFSQMYLIFEYQDRLILLDQHAAHERINYERLLADFVKEAIPRQSFLIPKRIELSLLQAQQAVQYEAELAHLGIVLEPFGGQLFIVQTMPAFLKDSDPHSLVVELLEEISQGYKTASLDQRRDAMLMRMACHGSVRGSHRLSAEEVRALMKQLDEIAFRGNCPHGRPIFFEMERAEIEKRFHRT